GRGQEREDHLEVGGRARDVDVEAVHTLLEHLDVVRLLGHLVHRVPELRVAVLGPDVVVHDAADEQHLELRTHLRDLREAVHPDLDLTLTRQRLVPGVASDLVRVVEDEARVVLEDLELRRLPVDVAERLEVLVDRGLRERTQRVVVALLARGDVYARGGNLLRAQRQTPERRLDGSNSSHVLHLSVRRRGVSHTTRRSPAVRTLVRIRLSHKSTRDTAS